MVTENSWGSTPNGLYVPPMVNKPKPEFDRAGFGYPNELIESVKSEVDTLVHELRENIPAGGADALGLQQYNFERQFGDQGFAHGATEEVMRLIAERLTAIHQNLYGSQYGYGYGTSEQDMGDTIRQLSALIWVFPEYNPLIKQSVMIRPLYVFGQGFEVRGESRKRKQKKIREIAERRQLAKTMQAQQQAAMMQDPSAEAGEDGQDNPSGRNALYQRYGGTGRSDSRPGGRTESMREEYDALEEDWHQEGLANSNNMLNSLGMRAGNVWLRRKLQEARSGAGGAQQGSRSPTGGTYRLLGSGEESDQAIIVREFWDDPCNMDRFCSTESMQRCELQVQIEGNTFVVLRSMGLGQMPKISVWPTHAVLTIIVDDLDDGTGIELGYIVNQSKRHGDTTKNSPRRVYPSMVADDVERLKKVLAVHRVDEVEIVEDARIYHMKEWGPIWRSYGLPSILASISSAARYMSFTSEWVIMQRIWRTYAMLITGYGNNKGLNQIGANFANRMAGIFGSIGGDTNTQTGMGTMPPVGLAAISGMNPSGISGTRMETVKTAGSTDPPALGREIRLLAEMGVGYPDNMYSDTNTGTMSRADALERNTHLQFLSQQQKYSQMFKIISRCVVKFQLGPDAVADLDVTVNWPAIVTPSTIEQIGGLVQAYQSDGIPKKIFVEECLKTFKRTDLHEIMMIMFPADEDGMEFSSDAQLDMMAMGQAQQAGTMEPSDPNNPLSGMESQSEDEWYGGSLLRG